VIRAKFVFDEDRQRMICKHKSVTIWIAKNDPKFADITLLAYIVNVNYGPVTQDVEVEPLLDKYENPLTKLANSIEWSKFNNDLLDGFKKIEEEYQDEPIDYNKLISELDTYMTVKTLNYLTSGEANERTSNVIEHLKNIGESVGLKHIEVQGSHWFYFGDEEPEINPKWKYEETYGDMIASEVYGGSRGHKLPRSPIQMADMFKGFQKIRRNEEQREKMTYLDLMRHLQAEVTISDTKSSDCYFKFQNRMRDIIGLRRKEDGKKIIDWDRYAETTIEIVKMVCIESIDLAKRRNERQGKKFSIDVIKAYYDEVIQFIN
jgi:hypothetical protein